MFALALLAVALPSVKSAIAFPVAPAASRAFKADAVDRAFIEGSLRSFGANAGSPLVADKDGWYDGAVLGGSLLKITVVSPEAGAYLMVADGSSVSFVNEEPRGGDPYQSGRIALPVQLQAGENELYFRCARGRFHLTFRPFSTPVVAMTEDATLPDIEPGKVNPYWGAVVLANGSPATQRHLTIRAQLGGKSTTTMVSPIPSGFSVKVPFRFRTNKSGDLKLAIFSGGKLMQTVSLPVQPRLPGHPYKNTFRSEIDGSVQYYAVNPVTGTGSMPAPALALSLHGASVEAQGQAAAYSSKSWVNLVAATNRRPYGYDWEDWGQQDALEVLADAEKHLVYDPHRIYLVGHSMGGHGTWHLGTTYPDLFAAIAPSAGWVSPFSYGGVKRGGSQDNSTSILESAGNPSDTLQLATNLAPLGVYILHGDADDNVPVTEARTMLAKLTPFHKDVTIFEAKGQNHWWDLSPEPGADAVDYGPMFEFLARHTIPPIESVRDVDFTTANPGISSTMKWVSVEQLIKQTQFGDVRIHVDPHLRHFVGSTSNVSRLKLSLEPLQGTGTITIELDGTTLQTTTNVPINLERQASGAWQLASALGAESKNPHRYGPFRTAFDHRFAFVVGTQGTADETRANWTKARYDAETWWMRANASPEIIADTDLDFKKDPDRDLILYGNAQTNKAWPDAFPNCPIQVSRGGVTLGDQHFDGDHYGVIYERPRPGSKTAMVAAIGSTGPIGSRLLYGMPYLAPMIGFPDFLIINDKLGVKGANAVSATGYWGPDWSLAGAEWSLGQ